MDEASLPAAKENLIRAAGGLVVRESRVLLVHRPRYDDWSLPKGKLERGETWRDGAVREVLEETNQPCQVVKLTGTVRYTHKGKPKIVAYFLMHPLEEKPFAPNEEVDRIQWCSFAQAAGQLSYDNERQILQKAEESP
ncbi:MAG: NUDIX hydrolase [Phycisphaeraceae bacterium]|nr:NUDIX hydrolase [Phycisphaeraceae bacterium]